MAIATVLRAFKKPTSKSLHDSNPSITLKIKGGARLCIEHDTGEIFKLFYGESDDSGKHNLNPIGTVNLDSLAGSLSVIPGCRGSATIETKIGSLYVADYRHASRLRNWLASYQKKQ